MPALSGLTSRLRGLFAKNVAIRYSRHAEERMHERGVTSEMSSES